MHDFQIDFLAAMAAPPFLFDLSITGMPGSYQLYISERALRFTDREEQNMKIIPRNMVSGITIRDTDLSFSTTDMPKALSCTGLTAAVSAWLARRSMYGLVHSKGGLDLCSLVGAGFGVWAGWKVGHAVFRKQHIVDGSFVQLHTSGGVTGFNCSDLKAQELVRLLLY